MAGNAKISQADIPSLEIIHYPDPRLKEVSTPVEEIDETLRTLTERMFELMYQARGVGLAASQVGITVRMFVASPSLEPTDRRVYVNPEIISATGSAEAEEGCLSFPEITCKIKRADLVTVRATSLEGEAFEETGEGLVARIFQHEMDHIEGGLILDRMGTVAKLANRKALKQLQEDFEDART